jgi:hypothetical protein
MKNITTAFITRTRLLAFLTITCFALGLAGAQADDHSLLMSFSETLTSNSTLDGNITLTGAFSERGTRHEDFAVIHVNNDGSQVVVAGTSTITSASGTMTTQWRGTIYFDNATFDSTLLAYIEGTESVTGGTGAYAGATGHGSFEATLDYTNGNVLGVFEANNVHLRH